MSPPRAPDDARPLSPRASLVLFWVLVVMLVGARVALFDEIRPPSSNATVSIEPGRQG